MQVSLILASLSITEEDLTNAIASFTQDPPSVIRKNSLLFVMENFQIPKIWMRFGRMSLQF